jgi:hypothetical protein
MGPIFGSDDGNDDPMCEQQTARVCHSAPPGKLSLVHAICNAGIVLDGKVQLGDCLMAADDLTVTDWRVHGGRTLGFWRQYRQHTEPSILPKDNGE